MSDEDGKVIDLADAVAERMAAQEDDEDTWKLYEYQGFEAEDMESMVGIHKADEKVFVVTNPEEKVGILLTPVQARIMGMQLLRFGTITNLVFEDESGTLDWLLAPEEL